MSRLVGFGLFAAVIAVAVAGCSPDYSPDVYSGDAVQQADKVEAGVVIGFRQVDIRSDGTVGAVAGGAAGGVLGTQAGEDAVTRALGAVGGALAGGFIGTAVEHTTGSATGWEYIVRESKGDLVSVTQRQDKPIAVGQKVLVIFGKQARIVPDYTAASAPPPTPSPAPVTDKSGAHAVVPPVAQPIAAASAPPTPITPAAAPTPSPAASPTESVPPPPDANKPDVPAPTSH
ncbi:MAG TPA: hypothetical protein VEU53_02935 [Stellaceae bacterium]|nr:hypothetical protein [Stellaceae bacterium]